jgi:hypothetical protein
VLRLTQPIGGVVVVTLKPETREVYPNARGLFQARPPDATFVDPSDGGSRCVQPGDTSGLPFTQDYPQPVRVLRAEEQVPPPPRRGRPVVSQTTLHPSVWITTRDQQTFPTEAVWRLGHQRGKNATNGWIDLTQHGAPAARP